MEAEEDLPTFRPFTREELATIDNRIFENKLAEKKKQERRDKNIAVSTLKKLVRWRLSKILIFKEFGEGARARKMYIDDSDDEEEEDESLQAPNPKLSQGSEIPRRYGTFPEHLASTPIVDIDPYYRDKRTFIVVSKGGAISRFSASSSLYILSPFHPIRRIGKI